LNAWESHQEERRQRYLDRAEMLDRASAAAYRAARTMADVIPFGQPILVGHHSEQRDRNYRAKIHRKFGQAFELQKSAAYYRGKAASVGHAGISSDDPAAIEKLRWKVASLEAQQARMVAVNKVVRKWVKKDHEAGVAALLELGIAEPIARKLFEPDCFGGYGFASYELTNNGANIRRIKERIEHLERMSKKETAEHVMGNTGVRIVENVEANRLQVFFPGKPAEEVRKELKGSGFRWAPSEGAWQRHLSSSAKYWAEQIINKHYRQMEGA
jgi:Domain of unknown function (DUF3560)